MLGLLLRNCLQLSHLRPVQVLELRNDHRVVVCVCQGDQDVVFDIDDALRISRHVLDEGCMIS